MLESPLFYWDLREVARTCGNGIYSDFMPISHYENCHLFPHRFPLGKQNEEKAVIITARL